ncbi:MAG: SPOR domain-containing protein [Clostridia bacterium]
MQENGTKSFSEKIFIASFLTLCFVICIAFASMTATLITSEISQINADNQIKLSAYNVFAINLGTFKTEESAKKASNEYRLQNASGFIWKHDGNFMVFASAYENVSDAEKVLAKISEKHETALIFKIELLQLVLTGNFSSNEKEVLSKSLSLFKLCFSKLLDITISLDTKISSPIECLLRINELKSDVSKIKSDLTTIFLKNSTVELLSLKSNIAMLEKKVGLLAKAENYENQFFSQQIKYTQIESISLQKQLYENILVK